MIQRWTPLLKLWLLVVAVLASGLGCAEEREPINRVQANALAKSFFVGKDLASPKDDPEFYTAMTVVDVPWGADQQVGAFTGLIGELRRVKWEITEDALNARLTYEQIDGSDGHGSRVSNNGRVIASYEITSHFDIRRSYNSSTGEELNVIEENESDRPWYEREYFRVDWSKNNINTSWWDPLAQADATGTPFEAESLAYYVSDPASPDAPLFVPDEGYFDFVNKLYLKPNKIKVDGQSGAECLWRGAFVVGATYPWGQCENTEITVRVSFKRIAQPGEPGFTDYEPVDWDGARMNAFGMFWQTRMGWDNHYGIVDDKIHRFGQRHNIWVQSHAKDGAGNYIACSRPGNAYDPGSDSNGDGTDDGCEAAGAGSRCDGLMGQCTIPFAKRQVKPVVWRYTVNGEDEVYYKSTLEAAWEWDAAMRVAVQAARRVECVKTNGDSLADTRWAGQPCDQAFPIVQADDAEVEAVRGVMHCWQQAGRGAAACAPEDSNSIAAMDPVVVLCKNPVGADDDPLCGPAGTRVRPGDIRYHHVSVWPTSQNMSPWGYGPSLADPLTGEIISVGVNVYASVTDTSAQRFLDTMRWINGELPTDQITSGSYVLNWTRANQSAENSNTYWPKIGRAEADRRVQSLQGMDPELIKNPAATKGAFDASAFKQLDTFLQATKVPNNTPGAGPLRAKIDARIALAKGTPVEAELMSNPMWLQLAGAQAGAPLDEQMLETASPLRGMNPTRMLDQERSVNNALARAGQCILAAPEPTGLPTFARVMQQKFPVEDYAGADDPQRVKDMWNYLRFKMHYSVILHEMGHTFGMTHNFAGSYDKFNYRPQYWQLRTKSGSVTAPCRGTPNENPENCIGPRYFDPPTPEETDGSIWTWMHTTVMDYPGDLTHDTLGLGVYDYAAVRMFYGDVVDLRNDGVFKAATVDDEGNDRGDGTREGEAIKSMVDFAGGLFGQNVFLGTGNNAKFLHHTQYQNAFQLLYRCSAVQPEPPAYWDEALLGRWDPLFDGHIVRNEVCERQPVDYASWNDLVPDQIGVFGDPKFFIPRRAKARDGRVRVPYSMEIDWYADGGSPSAYRHDNGADMYEELVFHSSLYENRHIFDNFRNGRSNFTIYGAYNRALSRYHAKIATLTGGYAYAVEFILRRFAEDVGARFDQVMSTNAGPDSFLYDHTVAASLGFDHFVRTMTRPQEGRHYTNAGEMLRSTKDLLGNPSRFAQYVTIPNGTSFTEDGSFAIWGRPIQNELNFSNGAWNADYLNQVGSYYEKVMALQMMLEASSETINFYRFDALDARLRYVNLAHLWPEGMRQLLGVLLTGDQEMYAPRMTVDANNAPEVVPDPNYPKDIKYPKNPFAWTTWTSKSGPQLCWTSSNQLACSDYFGAPIGNGTNSTVKSVGIEPNWDWEEQKFVVFWTYAYMPDSEQMDWVDMMRIFQLGSTTDPSYLPLQAIEFRDPESGLRYIAKKFGPETLFGKTWDKGIAAKMIQWANELAVKAYKLIPGAPIPETGQLPYEFDAAGRPIVLQDPLDGRENPGVIKCEDNRACVQLRKYRALLDFTRQAAGQVGFPEPGLHIVGSDPVEGK